MHLMGPRIFFKWHFIPDFYGYLIQAGSNKSCHQTDSFLQGQTDYWNQFSAIFFCTFLYSDNPHYLSEMIQLYHDSYYTSFLVSNTCMSRPSRWTAPRGPGTCATRSPTGSRSDPQRDSHSLSRYVKNEREKELYKNIPLLFIWYTT